MKRISLFLWPAGLLLAFALGAALQHAAPAWAQAAGLKIGVVNVDKVARDSKVGKAKFQALEAQVKVKESELQAEMTKIEALKKDYDAKQMAWSEDVRRQKQSDLELMRRSWERKALDYRDQLRKQEMEILAPMEKNMAEVIDKMAVEQKYDLIIDLRGQLIYYNEKLLITDEVTRYFDAH